MYTQLKVPPYGFLGFLRFTRERDGSQHPCNVPSSSIRGLYTFIRSFKLYVNLISLLYNFYLLFLLILLI